MAAPPRRAWLTQKSTPLSSQMPILTRVLTATRYESRAAWTLVTETFLREVRRGTITSLHATWLVRCGRTRQGGSSSCRELQAWCGLRRRCYSLLYVINTHAATRVYTKCASKKTVFLSEIKSWYFCLFSRAKSTILGVLVGFCWPIDR